VSRLKGFVSPDAEAWEELLEELCDRARGASRGD
jgi:hypothetical protein